MNNYIQICQDAIKRIIVEEKDNIQQATSYMVNTIRNDGIIHASGGHCQFYPIELFYRAGGLVPINPLLPHLFYNAAKSQFAVDLVYKNEGVGEIIFNAQKLTDADCIIVASVSGRTTTAVDVALAAKKRGIKIIAIQSMDFSSSISASHSSGYFINDIADVTIDMKVPYGDAVLPIKNSVQMSSPTSSVLGFSILQSLVTETVITLATSGFTPPVWASSNISNGDEINKKYIKSYKGRVTGL